VNLWDAIAHMIDDQEFPPRAQSALVNFRNTVQELTLAAISQPLDEALRFIVERTGYGRMLEQDKDPDAQNRLEKLRTPNKIRVYSGAEMRARAESAGLVVERADILLQPMAFDEWMLAAGAVDRSAEALTLLVGPSGEDLTGLDPRRENGRLVINHRTLILAARLSRSSKLR
jgi:hypothetical protein